jgi:SAM-dependent methyltransferase
MKSSRSNFPSLSLSTFVLRQPSGIVLALPRSMFQPAVSLRPQSRPYHLTAVDALSIEPARRWAFIAGIARRWKRERRRRKVAKAYDMALEVARVLPRESKVLDVGCGNGFIAHHLSAMLGTQAVGIDLAVSTSAPINYQQFDGRAFPIDDGSVDAVLLCYVLHHAQELHQILNEVRRVVRENGQAVIFEDIPATLWDLFICWMHNLKWRRLTGVCTFRSEQEWWDEFTAAGFEVTVARRLSRARNFAHPVKRAFFVLRNRPVEVDS